MKKQNAYTIKDEIFMDAIEIIHAHFGGTSYAIVGGAAVQIYVTSVSIRSEGLNSVNDVNGLSFVLRKTGDIDLSFNCDAGELLKKFNFIIESQTGTYTFHSFFKRFVIQEDARRFNLNYQIEPDDLKGMPSYYYDIIETAVPMDLPSKGKTLSINIARPEYLITSKLTRISPKDQIDIMLLLRAMEMNDYPFDSEEVRSILKSIDKAENYAILRELMDAV